MQADFGMWHTAPLLDNGLALLGEVGKWVPVSGARVKALETTASSRDLNLASSPLLFPSHHV